MMDANGDVLFPRRYLDEYEKRVSELYRCVKRARERVAEAMRHDVGLLLDAADAHEQAAMAYELAGDNGHARDFQARAVRHWQAAAARRATAASLASGVPNRHDSDAPPPQAVIPDGDRPGLPSEPDMGMGHPGVSCGTCHEQQRNTRFFELPYDVTHRAVGPWQAVLLLAVLLRRPNRVVDTRERRPRMVQSGSAGPQVAVGTRESAVDRNDPGRYRSPPRSLTTDSQSGKTAPDKGSIRACSLRRHGLRRRPPVCAASCRA
jgi:hypothetical protein